MSLRLKLTNFIKRVFKIYSLSLFIKDKKIKIEKLFYRKKYTAVDLLNHMIKMGLEKGSVVFIHCSMKEFYNYKGSVSEIIETILDYIGDEGTLLMPAYPKDQNPDVVFDVRTTPTGAGLLAETFRNYPGVKRSINMRHSVCAIGRQADYLLNEHHLSETCWDEKSPYYKMGEFDALVFSFGLEKDFIGTISHCPESLLWHDIPYFALFFGKKIEYKYIDQNGKTGLHAMYTDDDLERRPNYHRVVNKYFDRKMYKIKKLSNLNVSVYNAGYTIAMLTDLASKGIVIYTRPSTKGFSFKN